jgi:hypothetical protein
MTDNTKPQSKRVYCPTCKAHGLDPIGPAYGPAGGERCLRCSKRAAQLRRKTR